MCIKIIIRNIPSKLGLKNHLLYLARTRRIGGFFVCSHCSEHAIYCVFFIVSINSILTFVSNKQYNTLMDYSIIKKRRKLLGITQQELSDYSGISLRMVIEIEKGKANPSINTLSAIGKVLGLEIELKIKVPGK